MTTTSTSPTPSVTSTTGIGAIPGPICTRDADCAGLLCDGSSRCIEGRCRAGDPPTCFDGATCVLSARLPSAMCPEALPARVTRLFERAYVLVLGAEAVAPTSLKRATKRLNAAAKQLTRDGKSLGKLADKSKLPQACKDVLRARSTRALERTNALRNNLAACTS